MAISTNYSAYNSYASTLYNGVGSTASTQTKADGTTKQTTVATTLRESLSVEVSLSPAALQALAQYAAKKTDDTEEALTKKLRAVMSEIFIDSTDEARSADKARPKDTDAAH